MSTIERLRPTQQPLDAEWSAATLRHIFASGDPAVAPIRTTHRRAIIASAAAATAAAAAAIASTTLDTSAAFAVEQESNGDVVVIIHRLTDPSGLERALADHGIDADVTYLQTQVPSDLDDGSGPRCVGAKGLDDVDLEPEDAGWTFTFKRAYLAKHSDAELSLTAAGGASLDDWGGVSITWSDDLC